MLEDVDTTPATGYYSSLALDRPSRKLGVAYYAQVETDLMYASTTLSAEERNEPAERALVVRPAPGALLLTLSGPKSEFATAYRAAGRLSAVNCSDPVARRPSVDGIAVATGNGASPEAGHLLGLEHVAEVTALMDTTGTASTLLADQEFKVAPLDQSVFPIGEQDAPALLNKVIPP